MCKILEENIRIPILENLLESKYTQEKIDKATTAFFACGKENISTLIGRVALAVSYDMGWQKRSIDKLYDILSGPAFIL